VVKTRGPAAPPPFEPSRVRAGLGSTGWTAQCLAKRRITCAADAGELGKRGRQPAKPARGHPLEVGGAGAKRTSFLNVRTPETTAAAGATRKDEDCRCTGSLASTTAHEVAAAAAIGVCRARPLVLAALSYGSPVVQASGVGCHNCHLLFPATVRHAMHRTTLTQLRIPKILAAALAGMRAPM
jgi:hypothetical protein